MKILEQGRQTVLALTVLATSMPVLAAHATELPLTGVPVPVARPDFAASVDRGLVTATIAPGAGKAARVAASQDVSVLKAGLDAAMRGDIASARRAAERLGVTHLDRAILDWAMVLGAGDKLTSSEIAAIRAKVAHWPGQITLQTAYERALYREKPPASTVLAAFAGLQPQSAQGAIVLGRALIETGRQKVAAGMLAAFWPEAALTAEDEKALLAAFSKLISRDMHRARMEAQLYAERTAAAGRVASLAGAQHLYQAWVAVNENKKNAGKLLDQVPRGERTAGYVFAQARHLRRAGKFVEAAKVIARAPTDPRQLVDTDRWWTERRVLSRELLDIGQPKLAYQVAAAHHATGAESIADAEFHAGWYALRGLRDARTAMRHFARIAEVASGPISQARAHYWMGRAAEEGRLGAAEPHYARAARHETSFYGQLAAAKIGRDRLNASYPQPTAEDRQRFERRELVTAIRRLEAAGHASRANLLYFGLARELKSGGELALLAVMAESRGNHDLALRVGKVAASRGVPIGALAHPIGAIPASANIPADRKAMAYAVARQESEFNAGAVSRAGARGLLQLMPGTAREMGKKTGLGYSSDRLTNDAGYNAALGTAYLSEQIDRFAGSYIMTFAAYNAGPRRVAEWVDRYGDPRGKPVEVVVDWIERIPYTETRNYVQRVMENYQVYRLRLTGRFDIAGDLAKGG